MPDKISIDLQVSSMLPVKQKEIVMPAQLCSRCNKYGVNSASATINGTSYYEIKCSECGAFYGAFADTSGITTDVNSLNGAIRDIEGMLSKFLSEIEKLKQGK
jgi:hypothetical protein